MLCCRAALGGLGSVPWEETEAEGESPVRRTSITTFGCDLGDCEPQGAAAGEGWCLRAEREVTVMVSNSLCAGQSL